ncbi:MAG: Prophage ps3 protein 01 [Bacillales bacterium]|jgi:putative zinc finger/helix-turn-helix YgiT family protein|nr:Prophage ps3 protein 01 [Bacillales bacterium]
MDRKLCIYCLEHTNVEVVENITKKELHDEIIIINEKKYKCIKCNKIIPNNELDNENYDNLYRKFREKKHMLMPEEIKYIREDLYNISTRIFAQIIGCSPATLSRYENGALQSKQHDKQFKLLRDPKNMKILVEDIYDELPDGKRQELKERLDFLLGAVKVTDILKGFNEKLDILDIKLTDIEDVNVATIDQVENFFIIKGKELEEDDLRISPLKLQKLLYYAQGWSMALSDNQLFDADFQAWVHGPVIPEVYQKYKMFKYDNIDINIIGSIDNLNLTKTQLRILEWVWDKYSKFTAKFLEDLTHMEYPWRNTRADLPSNEPCDWVIDNKEIKNYFTSILQGIKLLKE